MRILHLYANRQENIFVQGPNSANPLGELRVAQGDTLQLVVHNMIQNTASPALTPFVEKPLVFGSMRASIGYVDKSPVRGSFKLKVADEITTELNWPADLTAAGALTTWKTAVLNALKALPGVGADGVRLEDPENTPGNLFYFTWTDPLRDDEIEIVENRLFPPTEATSSSSLTSFGFTQQVKLAQFPLRMTAPGAFTRPMPPVIVVIESRPGSAGTNAEQTIVVPAGAMGSVSFSWNGASTKTMEVATLTPSSIATALNAIVPNGSTNPSFRCEQRVNREGRRFAVEFIGDLEGAAQPMLGKAMHDQEAVPFVVGTFNLKGLPIEQTLNGSGEIRLLLELVIDDGGEETFLRELILVNDMTSGETASNAAEQGSVYTVETTVLVDAGLGEPFAEAAPGLSFIPPAAGTDFLIAHGFDTLWPKVIVYQRTNLDPEQWREVTDNEVTKLATNSNNVLVSFPFELSDDELTGDDPNPLWRENWKIYVGTPDAKIVAFPHKHDFDNILESLPGGQTLRTKLAALEAAIGIVAGAVAIPAGNITGTISPTKIDLTALIAALKAKAEFAPMLADVVNGNEALVTAIATRLSQVNAFVETLKAVIQTNVELRKVFATEISKTAEFVETLKTVITESSTIRQAVVEMLKTSVEFTSLLTERIISILTGGSADLPPGTLPMLIPDFEINVPPVQRIAAASAPVTAGEVEETVESGEASDPLRTKTVTKRPVTERQASSFASRFAALSRGFPFGSAGGPLTGKLPAVGTPSAVFEVGVGGAESGNAGGRRGRKFAEGAKLMFAGSHWFEVVSLVSGGHWPAECELELFLLQISASQLYTGGAFALNFSPWLQLQQPAKNRITARATLILERGVRVSASGADLASIIWDDTPLAEVAVLITDVLAPTQLALFVERTASAAFAAKISVNGQETAIAWTTADFALRARLTKFDLVDAASLLTEQRGSLFVRMKNATAGIAPIAD